MQLSTRNSPDSPKRHFWFFLSNESFISKTLDEGHVSLKNFPASRVRQMAKKLEGSQAIAKHIKQVTNEPLSTQINLLRHQRTELPPTKFQRKQKKDLNKGNLQTRNIQRINTEKENLKQKNDFTRIHRNTPVLKIDVPSVVPAHIKRDLDALPADSNANIATNMGISASYVLRKIGQNKRKISEDLKLTN